MAAKKKSNIHKTPKNHETNVKALVALFIVLLAAGVFFLFNTYQDNILSSSSSQFFMVLTVVFFGLLVGLFFLVSNPKKN